MATLINNDKAEDNCPICLENININNNSITLECQHRYCNSCIENLFSSKLNNKCPLCRGSIDLNKCVIKIKNNNYNNYNFDEKNNSNDNFIHFETKKICDRFLRRAIYKMTISNVCCGGTGCKINNLTSQQIIKLKKNFLESNTMNYN